jgi:hypothetical protein
MEAITRRALAPPYLIVAPMSATIGGFYGKIFAPGGIVGPIAGAVAGFVWAMLIGVIANRLMRRRAWIALLANAPVALAIIAIGLMTGAGLMYGWMMAAALSEPSTTYAVFSALMWPAVPFFITLNSTMEIVLVGLLVFCNWDSDPRRRALIVLGVAAYFVMRMWTYLVFAEPRLDIARHALSPADVEWFKATLAMDWRVVLNLISYICLVLAALLPAGRSFAPVTANDRKEKPATPAHRSRLPSRGPALQP